MKTGYLYFFGILVCLFYSCTVKSGMCRLEERYNCIPVDSYVQWNRCVGDCSDIKINSKTKPYEPKTWIRPRPYTYP